MKCVYVYFITVTVISASVPQGMITLCVWASLSFYGYIMIEYSLAEATVTVVYN